MSGLKPEEFPNLCETCLGDNPYLRMTREKYGKACKICERPFTVFRWKPGPRARFKKTEICPSCSRLKNVCQTCILDLEYGLPVQLRDDMLTESEKSGTLLDQGAMPVSRAGRGFLQEQMEATLKRSDDQTLNALLPYDKVKASTERHNLLMRLRSGSEYGATMVPSSSSLTSSTMVPPTSSSSSSSTMAVSGDAAGRSAAKRGAKPYFARNLPHICSFFVKGTCNRGSACPYRHEMPAEVDPDLARQNIKDRFYGVNDPVAKKLRRKLDAMQSGISSGNSDTHSYVSQPIPIPPSDQTIRTLWVGGVDEMVSEDQLREVFAPYGRVSNIHMAYEKQCAFVEYEDRNEAESAMSGLWDSLFIAGRKTTMNWSFRSQSSIDGSGVSTDASAAAPSVVSVPHSSSESTTQSSDGSSTVSDKFSLSEEQRAYLASMGLLEPSKPVI